MADTIAKALNEIMNAKKAGRETCIVGPVSKLLVNLFEIMKKEGYIDYKLEKGKFEKIVVTIKNLNECKAIKPRFYVTKDSIDKYVRRYLPARNLGMILISTNKGILTDAQANEKKIGGCLVAYCF